MRDHYFNHDVKRAVQLKYKLPANVERQNPVSTHEFLNQFQLF